MEKVVKYGQPAGKGLWHIVDKLGWSLCGTRLVGKQTEHEPDPGRCCAKCRGIQQKDDIVKTSDPTFQAELEALINKYSVENQSSTPDFILAEYLVGCLEVFNKTVIRRAGWYGREAGRPGCMEQPIPIGGAVG